MRPTYPRNPTMRVLVHGCRANGNGFRWAGSGYRRYATAKRPPPPASSSPKQQRPTPKPLPFQPAKPTPKPGTTSSGGHEDKKRPISEILRVGWFVIFGAGAAAACVGFFVASSSYYWMTTEPEHWTPGQEPETPTGRPSIQSPREFDQHLDKSEWRYGITKLRRRIAAEMARGHVLEVAIGSGRSLDYYDWSIVTEGMEPAKKEEKSGWFSWLNSKENEEKGGDEKGQEKTKVKEERQQAAAKPQPATRSKAKPQPQNEHAILSFTGVDISAPMMDLALTRIRQVVPHMADHIPKKPIFSNLATKATDSSEESISLANNRIRIFKGDAQASLPPPPSSSPSHPQKYDTIIQTFGLCSVRDPMLLLSNLASAVQPDTGRIVLLEHGRSWWELVNGLLDRSARQHFERFGCWWNRDIELVVRAAERAVPGLEVLRLERPGWVTLGTHVLVEMRVRGDGAQHAAAAAPTATAPVSDKSGEEEKPAAGWWSSVLSVNSGDKKPKDDK
ncbi:hypothetical protein F5Y04DRAFT_136541 [Hypomontagnella monticulosa]|nr:hypothetical protein F5Y04DRAFT_136541 [Hypomontagnella monticulosa]